MLQDVTLPGSTFKRHNAHEATTPRTASTLVVKVWPRRPGHDLLGNRIMVAPLFCSRDSLCAPSIGPYLIHTDLKHGPLFTIVSGQQWLYNGIAWTPNHTKGPYRIYTFHVVLRLQIHTCWNNCPGTATRDGHFQVLGRWAINNHAVQFGGPSQ